MDILATNVKKHIIPASQLPGEKKLYFSVIGDVPLGDNQSVLLHYTANQPYATLYVYDNMADLLPYLQVEQNAKINVFETVTPEDTVSFKEEVTTDTPKDDPEEAAKEASGDEVDASQD